MAPSAGFSLLSPRLPLAVPKTAASNADIVKLRQRDRDARARREAVQALALDASKGRRLVGFNAGQNEITGSSVHQDVVAKARAKALSRRLLYCEQREQPGVIHDLFQLGEAGAAALSGVLEETSGDLRRLILKALEKKGAGTALCSSKVCHSMLQVPVPFSPRISDLVNYLEDGTEDIGAGVSCRGHAATRRRALQALGQRGASAAPVASEVARHLKDNDVGVRRRAAEALARMSVEGEEAAVSPHGSALASCLNDENNFLRTSAAEAFVRMGAAAEPHAQDLAQSLLDPDADVRRKAAEALGRIGPSAARYVSNLAFMLHDDDAGCRRCAVEALLQMGPAAGPYANDLALLLDDQATGMRWSILEGLSSLGHLGVQALAGRLEDDNIMTRNEVSTYMVLSGDIEAMQIYQKGISAEGSGNSNTA